MKDTNVDTCGCCEGTEAITPVTIANPPGLDALIYRVGTHGSFLKSMLARLSALAITVPTDQFTPDNQPILVTLFPLRDLLTRAVSDFSIAMLDSWATVADVLTFYQERIANEGYLRTATERRSILELARLVGYKLRPGVAASVFLAYTLDTGARTKISAGSRVQSVPAPGETMQSFETSADLEARGGWNNLQPRLKRFPYLTWEQRRTMTRVYFQGITTGLKRGDPVVFSFGPTADRQAFRRVNAIATDITANRTTIDLDSSGSGAALPLDRGTVVGTIDPLRNLSAFGVSSSSAAAHQALTALQQVLSEPNDSLLGARVSEAIVTLEQIRKNLPPTATKLSPWLETTVGALIALLQSRTGAPGQAADLGAMLDALVMPPSVAPASPQRLARDPGLTFGDKSDAAGQLLLSLTPALRDTYYSAIAGFKATRDSALRAVYGFKVKAAPFGHNAPLQVKFSDGEMQNPTEWDLSSIDRRLLGNKGLDLDAKYDQITVGSWLVLEHPDPRDPSQSIQDFYQVTNVQTLSRADYGMSAEVTRVFLDRAIFGSNQVPAVGERAAAPAPQLQLLRELSIYAQPEPLTLAEEPIADPVMGDVIELDGVYDGLVSGRWIIVEGERADVAGSSGVRAAELAMLKAVRQDVYHIATAINAAGEVGKDTDLPGDTWHTFLTLSTPLGYEYKRDVVRIYGNVARATHGETRSETLGGGDATLPFQSFVLLQSPVTYVSASTASGAESTLHVRVNDLLWHEADDLAEAEPNDRLFITRTDDRSKTSVQFGDGKRGLRPPTGAENIRAVYRIGIGKPGNVAAGRISQLASRPLGVQSVINPLAATGGADRESRDDARRNIPYSVLALDRLVSVQDYADFSRIFAGIGKAQAALGIDPVSQRYAVSVTVAGADDTPLTLGDDVYRNLLTAFQQLGDQDQLVELNVRRLRRLVICGVVSVLPDYLWETVEAQIRSRLLDVFSFARRDLGQSVHLSEIMAAIQGVPGVDYLEIQILAAIDADKLQDIIAEDKSLVMEFNLVPPPPAQIIAQRAEWGSPADLIYLDPSVPDTLILKPLDEGGQS
ncbi:MAG TPA: putative baseplate assembly protein [Aggregatilineales bacterium]|nr:putative baseplate assembly protein [Aggregatilineales bacterium]